AVIDQPRHPYTAKLLGTVPVVGSSTRDLVSIPGHVPDPGMRLTGCAFHDRCDRATGLCAEADPPARTFDEDHLALCHHAVRHQQVTEAP
ncbi:MAG: oligopeptide ABC transporter ATP-binding protein OppD, partial [Mesorhizobium sp.]